MKNKIKALIERVKSSLAWELFTTPLSETIARLGKQAELVREIHYLRSRLAYLENSSTGVRYYFDCQKCDSEVYQVGPPVLKFISGEAVQMCKICDSLYPSDMEPKRQVRPLRGASFLNWCDNAYGG
jgi:hypothetical protein